MSGEPGQVFAIKPQPLVRAVQLTADADWDAIAAWCGGRVLNLPGGERELHLPNYFDDDHNAGSPADLGDWIIRGVTGRFFWRDAEAFAAYYVPRSTSTGDQK